MTKLQNGNMSLWGKLFSVITCALMTGFMWRVRGDHGWGSMWGMFAVGVMLILFIYAVFGERKRMNYEMLPVAVLLLGITNGGWGTLNSQMGGYLTSTAAFTGEDAARLVEINPVHGLFMMLFLGFGWMPLFALVVGSLFSKKEYKLKHYIILIAVFYAVTYIFKFSLSHFILEIVHPEAVAFCKEGLADAGLDVSPMMAYIKEFGSASWAKKIPFARNYFTSIDVMSAAFGALFSSLGALLILKDKFTAVISLLINTVCALSITVADIFLIMDSDRGLIPMGDKVPMWIQAPSWSLWEFFTGFLLGLGIMLILVCIPKKYIEEEAFVPVLPLKNRVVHYIFTAGALGTFMLSLTLIRPLGMRLGTHLFEAGLFEDEDTVGTVIAVVLTVIAAAVFFVIFKGLLKEEKMPFGKTPAEFSRKAVLVYFLATSAVYFFTDDELPFEGIHSKAEFMTKWNAGGLTVLLLTLIAFVLFIVFYTLTMKSKNKKS
ncbi:MAG: hypothetical protein E7573_11300 [Ruminococcaceae bacterium]|nr:hypothetical protein [Oscillospiraceae bacterium]